MRLRTIVLLAGAVLALPLLAAPAADARSGNVAALQVALRAVHVYRGGIDGVVGPRTRSAVRHFQHRHHLAADGVAGPRTRRAMGRRGRPAFGSRTMRRGARGWDVAALQFLLRSKGASPGSVDGGYGNGTAAAVRRFQRRSGLHADGVAGPATQRALRRRGGFRRRHRSVRLRSGAGSPSGPVAFLRPVRGPIGDGFGHPGGRRHDGIDFPVPAGTPIRAAGRGTVIVAGWNSGGYGNWVIVKHRLGWDTRYAHMSRIAAYVGEPVSGGTLLGYVGSTGYSTGPHLHFETRLNGVPMNPIVRLLATVASRKAVHSALAAGARAHAHEGCDPAKLRQQGVTGGAAPGRC
jgi:murein DD-endopeptidase MepM/ murein hydrolase activator NlpD